MSLFESKNRKLMESVWQDFAEMFYPERAVFTRTINVNDIFNPTSQTSIPSMFRRDLANLVGSILRDGDTWFSIATKDHDELSDESKQWLEDASKKLMRIMYNTPSNFVTAVKQSDNDYVTFGQCVISIRPDIASGTLLFENHHLKDCAWEYLPNGTINKFERKYKLTRDEVKFYFPDATVPGNAKDYDIIHTVERINSDEWSSKHVIQAPKTVLEDIKINYPIYIVPRFYPISGTHYAFSPATTAAVGDTRTLNEMIVTLLNAGQRLVEPPVMATQGAITSDLDLSASGVTWLDQRYDQRTGKAIETIDFGGGAFPWGMDQKNGVIESLRSAFFLDRLKFPDISREMTAYEVAERMKMFRRESLPLFDPIEREYNAVLCETAFKVALDFGMLGALDAIPEELSNAEVSFKFQSPLSIQDEEIIANKYNQMLGMVSAGSQFDPEIIDNIDFDKSLRDSMQGLRMPGDWLVSDRDVIETRTQRQQLEIMQNAIAGMSKNGTTDTTGTPGDQSSIVGAG